MEKTAPSSEKSEENPPSIPPELSNQQPGLLRLPAELRNQIYSQALPTHDVVNISNRCTYTFRPFINTSSSSTRKEDVQPPVKRAFAKIIPAHSVIRDTAVETSHERGHLGILQTCSRVRSEAQRFYYGHNAFVLPISPADMPQTRRWVETRPAEFFAVTREVYFSQEMRRCSSRSAGSKERLLCVRLASLEMEIVPLVGLHHGCLTRYVEHIAKKRERGSYRRLRERFEVGAGPMVELAEMMQHNGKSAGEIDREIFGWSVMPFMLDWPDGDRMG